MRSVWLLLRCTSGLAMIFCSLILASCTPSSPPAIKTVTPQPTQITTTGWATISLPSESLLSYAVSPSDPTTIYACTGSSNPGQIVLWHGSDAGQKWAKVILSDTTGTNCSISIDPYQSSRVAVLITNNADKQRPCDRDILYVSNDSGTTWRHIPHTSIAPPAKDIDYCQITVVERHLYWWYSYSLIASSSQLSILERSDDDQSWTRADSALGHNGFFFPPQIIKGSNVLSTIVVSFSPNTRSVLWQSRDAGRSWLSLGPLPGDYLLSSQSSPEVSFYALAHEQLPPFLNLLQAYQSTDGHHWSLLPPLPVPGATPDHSSLLDVLSTTDDGSLLAFGADPKIGVPKHPTGQPITQFRLWLWDSHASRWQVFSLPLNYTAKEGCTALCWSTSFSSTTADGSYLYAHYWSDGNTLFRIRIPQSS
jgi:hypothetical protein